MKKIISILLALICAPAAAQNYLRDDGTFHSVVEGTTTNQVLVNSAGSLAGVATVASSVFLTDASAVPYWSTTIPLTFARERLVAARTYYVQTAGSDINCSGLVNGPDPGSGTVPRACAFSTPQKPITTALTTLDLAGFTVTVDLTGAFTSGIACSGTFVGSGSTAVLGSGSIIIKSTAGASITATSANAIQASEGCNLTITGANLTLSTVTGGVALIANNGGSIAFGGLTFGAAATGHIQAGWLATPTGSIAGPGTIYITGDYSITGGAGFHWHVPTAGSAIIAASATTATLTGTPAFSNFTVGITKGLIYAFGFTFTGAATGTRYLIHNSGTLVGLSRIAIPGNVTGTVSAAGMFSTVSTEADNDLGVGFISGSINAAPATSAVGYVSGWFDTTDLRWHDKNSNGTIGTTIVADTGASNNFLTAISASGAISKAQPTVSNIGGFGASVATALGVNVGTAGAFVVNGGALGSPSSAGTIPAFTLGGTIAGGGNQINNAIIGTTTPLAGFFTTLSATTSLTSPLHIGGSGTTGIQETFQTTTGNGTTDSFAWKRGNNGATTAMILDNNGLNVGNGVAPDSLFTINGNTVATGAPSATTYLHIVGADAAIARVWVDSFGSAGNLMTGRASGGTAASPSATPNGTVLFGFGGAGFTNALTTTPAANITFTAASLWSATNSEANITFGVTPNGSTTRAEAGRFSSSGGFSVGTTTDPGIGSAQINANIFAPNLPTTTAALAAALCWTVTTGQFQRDTNAGGCLVSSERYKHDIKPLPMGLPAIMAMKPVSFVYNDDVGIKGEQVGFVAEQIATVDPRLVGLNGDGKPESVKYMQMTAVLTKAIQELKVDNDSLRACQGSWKCRIFGVTP